MLLVRFIQFFDREVTVLLEHEVVHEIVDLEEEYGKQGVLVPRMEADLVEINLVVAVRALIGQVVVVSRRHLQI